MQILNATPPADFPSQCIILDRDLATRHPDKGFYLRVQVSENEVRNVELDGVMTLPAARQVAKAKGFSPTHWMETTDARPWTLP